MTPVISEFPSRNKRQYFYWSYPPLRVEQKNWEAARSWIESKARDYEKSRKLYSRDIFSDSTYLPGTDNERFLIAVDHAVIESVLDHSGNPWVLVGKWLITVGKDDADDLWQRFEQRIERGKLPYRAKISTARENFHLRWVPKDERLICLYTPNYLWRKDVRKARRYLRAAGFHSRLYYKPDVFTILETRTVKGTDFRRSIFRYLRSHGVYNLKAQYRYFG